MSRPGSVHIWGFYGPDGCPRTADGAAPSTLTVFDHHRRLQAHVEHFGGALANVKTTRTLDGWLVKTEFDAVRDGTSTMWHQVTGPGEEWPDVAGVLPPEEVIGATTTTCSACVDDRALCDTTASITRPCINAPDCTCTADEHIVACPGVAREQVQMPEFGVPRGRWETVDGPEVGP